ncbi:hypothetical protein L6452_15252 [Arctium lappa]|uniref:Uncharacterized protein n=1 Tax=Arctium lappa TaxID=4217 RepID=A0ACB9CN69_ARCLA|nr:hypothetical protein L6452_15252 [Arctium lappa]
MPPMPQLRERVKVLGLSRIRNKGFLIRASSYTEAEIDLQDTSDDDHDDNDGSHDALLHLIPPHMGHSF